MDLHPDFKDLLAEFVRCGVEFVLIGGYAVGHHAKPRATKDLDLLIVRSDANLNRAATALDTFGAPPSVVEAVRQLKPDEVAYLGVPPVRIDILCRADGITTEEVVRRAVSTSIGGLTVPVIALDDLIANKRASGRTQDKADVELLERARAMRLNEG